MRNITLSADENLIEAARRRAAAQHTTLNASFGYGFLITLGESGRPPGRCEPSANCKASCVSGAG